MPHNGRWRLGRSVVLLGVAVLGWCWAAAAHGASSSSSEAALSLSSLSRWGRYFLPPHRSTPSHPVPRGRWRRRPSAGVRWGWGRLQASCSSSSSAPHSCWWSSTSARSRSSVRSEGAETASRVWLERLRGGSSTSTIPDLDVSPPSSTHLLPPEDYVEDVLPPSPTAVDSPANQPHDTATSAAFYAEEQKDEDRDIPQWKRAFPDALRHKKATFQKLEIFHPPPSHTHLPQHQTSPTETLPPVTIYLLGTAHVSNDSCRDVKILLETIRPEGIFVELCDARIPLLTLPPVTNETLMKNATNATAAGPSSSDEGLWSRATAVQQAQGTSRLQALSTVMLTSVQEDYAKDLGVELGGEFRAAYQFWQASRRNATVPGATNGGGATAAAAGGDVHFILGDRPVHITLRRAWESLRFWPKLKVVVGLLWSCLHKPDPEEIKQWLQQVLSEESDILTKSFEELQKHFPSLHRVIIEERDAYLAAKLVQTCRCLAPGSRVVAVVGAGHVPGICQWLGNTTNNYNNTHHNATDAVAAPERVLAGLVTTRPPSKRRRRHATPEDEEYEKELIHACIHQVAVLQDMPDESFQWAGAIP